MATPKPFALDLGPVSDLEDLKRRCHTLFDNANFMFEQLYRDLAAANPNASLSTTGLLAKIASGQTYTTRTIQGGTGISVANGDGVNGNPTISLGAGGVTVIKKPTDQSITNSSTLQDDADFQFAAAANVWYLVHCYMVLVATSTTPDWKFAWSLPAGASVLAFAPEWNQSVAAWNNVSVASSPAAINTGTLVQGSNNNTHAMNFVAILQIAGTPGTAKLQWAQNTAGGVGVTSTVKAGSTMLIH
jgi:hypothetical protein